ncbi:MAG: hypothetical protein J6K55_01530 [Clostridia bacterium]|nr:hypothetical protein [Clostridia bacterium]
MRLISKEIIAQKNDRWNDSVDYTMTMERLTFGSESAEATAHTYTYTAKDGPNDRPVVFVFNGGPGSSGIWMHLGFAAPRRVRLDNAVNPTAHGPYVLEDNPFSLIEVADTVIIDPVETGYSRLLDQSKAGEYLSVDGDAATIAILIADWLRSRNRLNAPRYLMGESYGTYRMPYVVRELFGGPFSTEHKLRAFPVDGLLMLGSALVLAPSLTPDYPSVYPSAHLLPDMAAANHYHRPEGKHALKDWINEVWDFCSGEYLTILFRGNSLTGDERRAAAEKLSWYTGVDKQWFMENGFEITHGDFTKLCLRDRGLDVGVYDARYTMRHTAVSGDPVGDDPAMGKYSAAFAGCWEAAFKPWAGIETDEEYRLIDFTCNGRFNMKSASNLTPTQCLEMDMRRDENLRVMQLSGVYDLCTSFSTVRYMANHMNIDKNRLTLREYESGHMPYLGDESAKQLTEDIRAFITAK